MGVLASVQSRIPRDEFLPLARRFDVLGSVGTAVYRTELCDGAPSELAGGALEPARDGLGGAVEAVGPLPARVAAELIEAAEGAFVLGLQTAAAVGAAAIAATAIVAGVLLRRQAAEREASRSFSSAPEP